MNDWLHNLPILWMTLLVFGFTYLVTTAIYAVVALFAVGERAKSFKAVSPGLLSPLGVLFGLFVAFTAAQVWADNEKARAEIDREASSLRNVVILASAFPKESEVQLRELVRRYIADAANQEWPMMAQGKANLKAIPGVMTEALQTALALHSCCACLTGCIVSTFEFSWVKLCMSSLRTALASALDGRSVGVSTRRDNPSKREFSSIDNP